jgi:hypothetical protein
MKENVYSHKLSESMNAGFVKILQDKLMDEQRPFEMRMRRIVSGIWEVEIYTNEESYQYFRNLLNTLV